MIKQERDNGIEGVCKRVMTMTVEDKEEMRYERQKSKKVNRLKVWVQSKNRGGWTSECSRERNV